MTRDDISSTGRARKLTLPHFVLSEVCDATAIGAVRISLPAGGSETAMYERPKLAENGRRIDGKPIWKESKFNLFPVVLCASSLPWTEATLYLLYKIESVIHPVMSTLNGIAEDLSAYRRFLDEEMIQWDNFPFQKLARPTYRYSSYLRTAVYSGDMAASSARRRMGAVIAFYNWLRSENLFVPAHIPWKEKDVYLKLKGNQGFEFTKSVTVTDISIRIPKQSDPYGGRINDGGKLRPLSTEEQRQLMEALCACGNTEMTLIHLFSLVTGARIQSVLTVRVRHVCGMAVECMENPSLKEIRFAIGPGTGVDTKLNKQLSLHIPRWFVSQLVTYVDSERAKKRRELATRGDAGDEYLFLSKYGAPFYRSREDMRIFDPTSQRRNPIKGQSVRKFMSEMIIPFVRSKYDPKFRYQFHDLRASFGMNLTDSQLKLVEQKRRTLHQVREFVKVRMGHASATTTDCYLQFRGNLSHIQNVTDDHDQFLRNLAVEVGLI